MENDAAVGWIAAIIIGGVAGWLAEQFMKSNMGLLMNIVLGIVGAIVANAILGLFGIVLTGWIGYLIAGFIGACILIAIARMLPRPGHRGFDRTDASLPDLGLEGSSHRSGRPLCLGRFRLAREAVPTTQGANITLPTVILGWFRVLRKRRHDKSHRRQERR